MDCKTVAKLHFCLDKPNSQWSVVRNQWPVKFPNYELPIPNSHFGSPWGHPQTSPPHKIMFSSGNNYLLPKAWRDAR